MVVVVVVVVTVREPVRETSSHATYSLENSRPQSFQLPEPLWTDRRLNKCARAISTEEKKSAGGE